MQIVPQVIATLGDVMTFIAPNAGGSVPQVDTEEFNQWKFAIQVKYEEAARRGFWRRLLVKDSITVAEGDESVVMPIQFQRANALYIFVLDGEDLGDPDRILTPDSQTIFAQQITDPDDPDFGLWQLNFKFPIVNGQDCILWYFAMPPKPTETTDKLLLQGDMVAFGAMSEIFRSTNLEGSQDDARTEYENRLNTYLSLEMIPPRNELIIFSTNPGRVDRTAKARSYWRNPRSTRVRRR